MSATVGIFFIMVFVMLDSNFLNEMDNLSVFLCNKWSTVLLTAQSGRILGKENVDRMALLQPTATLLIS